MSRKRSESNKLKASVEQQLAAAAKEIFRLLQERGRAELEELRGLVMERLAAAVELIFKAFEANKAAQEGSQEPRECPRANRGEQRRGQCLQI